MQSLGGTVFLFSFGIIGTCGGVRLLYMGDDGKTKIALVLIVAASASLYAVMFGPARPRRNSDLDNLNEAGRLTINERKKELSEKEKRLSKFYNNTNYNSDIDEDSYKIDQNSDFISKAKELKDKTPDSMKVKEEKGLDSSDNVISSPDFDSGHNLFSSDGDSIIKFGDDEE